MCYVNVNPQIDHLGLGPSILSGVARQYDARYAGPASIKTVVEGEAVLEVGGKNLSLKPGVVVFVGNGQEYRLTIESKIPVRTLSYFSPDLGSIEGGVYVTQENRRIQRVTHAMDSERDALWDRAFQLQSWMQRELGDHGFRISSVGVRESTRLDLVPILNESRNYLLSHAESDVDLCRLASQAGISAFHFHRLYRKTFGLTPIQDQANFRCSRAMELLRSGLPASEVCFLVGFESHSAFSRAFRRLKGSSPSEFARSV